MTDYGPLTSPLDAVYVVDTRTGKLMRRVHVRRDPVAVAVDERRNRVIVGGPKGIAVLDAQSGAILRSIDLPVDAIDIDERAGDFIAGNDFYVIGTPVQGNGIMQQILRAIQTSHLNPGAANHHMNGGVSVVNLRSTRH